MPLLKIEYYTDTLVWCLWEITEDEDELYMLSKETKDNFKHISNEKVRKQSIGGRVALNYLLNELDIVYHGIRKKENGKPFLINQPYPISISHSKNIAAAFINLEVDDIGIDIEGIQPKVLKLLPRFANENELNFAHNKNDNPTNSTIIWTLKEAVYKAFGKLNIEFKSQIETQFLNNEITGIKIKELNSNFRSFQSKSIQFDSFIVSIVF
ncbi:4'-phosphopantetheinyl transferase family protein [Flammeovirga kamogawensis]|uniref:4'-phosphopantetheinyl transferase superfamily protein n=1 Tax=Flammeovirga kamogawensis TaxID=373891 RepID=A0ABX8GW60_9BACT|nr:4'-phosphopantetheinyl transferase superfamily protein [Flammeovirga kamogawensis]MBB6461284.1 phosphopantetheinyl transferase [Flammeovirga kamogawensis]QWG07843.1 4'-phosphopantetheinyl transferase superfamily protein [Flammeovirga kamogawensis]TRX69648.1 4'-phosphopantetheinyl transferase superfamily protein [Flammeovirga kamogawensis]